MWTTLKKQPMSSTLTIKTQNSKHLEHKNTLKNIYENFLNYFPQKGEGVTSPWKIPQIFFFNESFPNGGIWCRHVYFQSSLDLQKSNITAHWSDDILICISLLGRHGSTQVSGYGHYYSSSIYNIIAVVSFLVTITNLFGSACYIVPLCI